MTEVFPVWVSEVPEPGQSGLDVLSVGSPVLFAPAGVDDEVCGVLEPVEREADQVGPVLDSEHGAHVDGADEDEVTKTYPDQSPGHLNFPTLDLLPGLQHPDKKSCRFL